ncbi:MAG: lytic transglycosylase domain-containing protein [Patescibacteria group bacterium]|jgi:hypothetical protein
MAKEISRRDFLRLSGLTIANLSLPKSRELRQDFISPEYHFHNFYRIHRLDFQNQDIRNTNSGGPLTLATTLTNCGAIDCRKTDEVLGLAGRALIMEKWNWRGCNLSSLQDLAASYGCRYHCLRPTEAPSLHNLSSNSPAPLLIEYPDNHQNTAFHNPIMLIVGTDLANNQISLYNPCSKSSSEATQTLPFPGFFSRWPNSLQRVLVPTENEIRTLDIDDIPTFLAPQVLSWRQEIIEYTPEGFPPSITAILMQLESLGDQYLVSHTGALGLLQVMPFHFRQHDDPLDPKTNIQTGFTVFRECLNKALASQLPVKEALIEAAANYSGGSRQYGKDFYAFFVSHHQGIDDWYKRRSGN